MWCSYWEKLWILSTTFPSPNSLHTGMQLIFSSDVRYFHIFASGNANNASLHSSVHSFNFPLILQISLPSSSCLSPAELLHHLSYSQHPSVCESRAKQSNACTCLTCYCLCLDFTAYPGEATWNAPRSLFSAERKVWYATSSLCWGCPNEEEVCRTGSNYSSPSLPEGFTWNEQPCKRLWKGPINVMWLGGLQPGQNDPLLSCPEHLDKPLLHYTAVLHDLLRWKIKYSWKGTYS